MALGEKIRELRVKKGLTQNQLAGDHITRNMLSQIENGIASPSMKTLTHLAEKLDVSVGYLLEEGAPTASSAAKKLIKKGNYAKAIAALDDMDPHDDEAELLLATAYGELAMADLQAGKNESAVQLAERSLQHNEKSFFCSRELRTKMLWISAFCRAGGEGAGEAMAQYREAYQSWGWEAKHHLLEARHHLNREQIQAAEREIWTITVLPEEERAHYLLLRGWLALRQEKYGNAVSYLKQVEEMNPDSVRIRGELYSLLELAYKELDDYKAAYEYAAKQRELQ